MKNKLCVVIISFDKYLHLSEITYLSILKFWPENKYDIFYISNFGRFSRNYNGISRISVGKDYSWSSSLSKALIELNKEYDYVLTLIDDLVLTKNVNNNEIELVLEEFFKIDGDCIKLINKPKPNKLINKYFGELKDKSPYRATVVFTVWKIKTLLNTLSEKESAWDFEKNAVNRLNHNHKFYSVYTSKFTFFNTVIKGKYQLRFKKIIKDLNIDQSILPEIKYFTLQDILKRQFLKFRHKVYMLLSNLFFRS